MTSTYSGLPIEPMHGTVDLPRERPIIFSAEMVRAILDGRKTQTRRVVKNAPAPVPGADGSERMTWDMNDCPYGSTGDNLWVRESFAVSYPHNHLPPRLLPRDVRIYYASSEERRNLRGHPSIHMPRWASRITLEVTDVRVERLQEISDADARAEGSAKNFLSPRDNFCALWQQINGDGSWDANPWVWVIGFKVKP